MMNTRWLNWFDRRSGFKRFPAVVYLIPFVVGSIIWRLGQVHWGWWERDVRLLPVVLVFCLLIVLVFRSVTLPVRYVLWGKVGYLIGLAFLVLGGFFYTGLLWKSTELPDYYRERAEGSGTQVLAGNSANKDGFTAGTQFSGKTVVLRARVTDIHEDERGMTLTVRPLAVYSADGQVRFPRFSGKVEMVRTALVNLPAGSPDGERAKPTGSMSNPESFPYTQLVKLGDLFIFKGELSLYTAATNPGQFDYRRYQRYRKIVAQMVEGEGEFVARPAFDFMRWLEGGKSWAEQFFQRKISAGNQPFLMALFTGETDYLSEVEMEQIRNLGLSHIIAISGLHLSLVVIWLRKILQWCRVPRSFFPACLLTGIWVAVFFAGSQPSALRVGIYLTLVELGNFFGRRIEPLNLLAVTAWLILLWNPLTLFLLSFQLSFVTYLALMVLAKPIYRVLDLVFPKGPALLRTVQQSLAMSLASFIGSAPIVLFAFYQLPLQGILMNLWAVPLSEVILILLLFTLPVGAVVSPLGGIMAFLLDKLVGLFNWLTRFSSAAFGHVWQPGRPLVFWIAVFYLTFLMLWRFNQYMALPVLWQKREWRLLRQFFLVVSLVILLVSVWPLAEGRLEWILLDIGQGDGMFFRFPNGFTMLVDGGGQLTGANFAGEKIIKPFLLSRGVQKINLVCITHGDADHARGLLPVLSEFAVQEIWMPAGSNTSYTWQVRELAANRHIPVEYPVQGDILHFGEVALEVLHPALGEFHDNENDQSIVLRLTYHGRRILLMGDLSGEEEVGLLKAGIPLGGDFLKIAHHGSKYSTTLDFLEAVNPQIAFISVGKNRYGHPAPETLDRLWNYQNNWNGLNCPAIRTDQSGAVRLLLKGDEVELQSFKAII